MASPYLNVFRSPRIAAVLVLGFSSGLPLALTGSTLQAWLAVSAIDIKTIAWFSWIGMPYALKFLWSPLMDRYVPPILGRRRGWMLCSQIALLFALPMFGAFDPAFDLWSIAVVSLAVAFFSATQDIVLDAYRREILSDAEPLRISRR